MESTIPDLEVPSFLNCENILDSEIDLEEIECALKALKLGKSGGIDSLDPEHICFGGETLRLWLKKIFNRIIALEQIPTTLNEGLIFPVHKGKAKTLSNQKVTEESPLLCHLKALRNYSPSPPVTDSGRSWCA